jgi:hypothetical protein
MHARSAILPSRRAGAPPQLATSRAARRPLLAGNNVAVGGGGTTSAARRTSRPSVATFAVKLKSGRQVACSKTLVAKPEHADAVAEMLQAVVREHYGPLSAPPARRRSDPGGAPPLVADVLALAAAAEAAEAAAAAAADAPAPAPPTAGAASPAAVDPDLPRLLSFHAERDQWDRNVFHMWLQAASNEALGRVDTAPRALAFMRDAAPLLERPVGMLMYNMGADGSLGAPAVQGGPKGEGGLDDATGASGMTSGASGGQTSAALAAMVAQAMNEHAGGEEGGGAARGGGGGGGGGAKGGSGPPPSLAVVAGGVLAVAAVGAAVWWWGALGGGGPVGP